MSVFHKMRSGTGVTYMVEFQMQPDEDIYPRVCVMRGLYKQRMNPHYVCNVILFLNKKCDPRTQDFKWMFNGCTTDFQVLYLDQVVKELADAQPEHPLLANLFVKCGLDNEKDRALASPHIKPSPTLRMINKIADRHFKINQKLEKLLQKGLIDQEEYEELALPYIKVPLATFFFLLD